MTHGDRITQHGLNYGGNVCGMKGGSFQAPKSPNPPKVGKPVRDAMTPVQRARRRDERRKSYIPPDADTLRKLAARDEARDWAYENKCLREARRKKHQRETWERTKRLLGWR